MHDVDLSYIKTDLTAEEKQLFEKYVDAAKNKVLVFSCFMTIFTFAHSHFL